MDGKLGNRQATEFRRRYGVGGPAPDVSLTGGGGKISYNDAARMTLECADRALGVQEDTREAINRLTNVVAQLVFLIAKREGVELPG